MNVCRAALGVSVGLEFMLRMPFCYYCAEADEECVKNSDVDFHARIARLAPSVALQPQREDEVMIEQTAN